MLSRQISVVPHLRRQRLASQTVRAARTHVNRFAHAAMEPQRTSMDKSVIHTSNITSPFHNQGIAMPVEQRDVLRLAGRIPSGVDSLAQQQDRALRIFRQKSTPLEKYLFLAQIRNYNTHLFYKLVCSHVEELAPIIYTPTVGEACVEYSHIYPFLAPPGGRDGLFVSINDLPRLGEMVRDYCGDEAPEIAVITDGSRILGLGDLGVNGIGIPIGKLQLYTAAAGIHPQKTLPIVLDFGTNNERYLNDPFYIGLRQGRPDESKFYGAMDRVMNTLYDVFPDILVQFEDFQSHHAFGLLEAYQDKVLCFNDDIQGTGAVILAGCINAFRLAQERGGVDPRQQRIVFFGAGSSAIGVGKQLLTYFMQNFGLTEQEAKSMFYYVDSKGLITQHRGDRLASHKVYFARDETTRLTTLEEVVEHVRPTTLIGLSAQPQAFTSNVLARMAEWNKAPIILPLSNPMTNAECTFAQAMQATDTRAIFASGTAFPAYKDTSTGRILEPGQGNNMYIFPGLGLGTIVAKTPVVSDAMIFAAAQGLSQTLTPEERHDGDLYPDLSRIRDVSAHVAAAVCRQALTDGIVREPALLNLGNKSLPEDHLNSAILELVRSHMWHPDTSSTAPLLS